jgi:acyl carrier protein
MTIPRRAAMTADGFTPIRTNPSTVEAPAMDEPAIYAKLTEIFHAVLGSDAIRLGPQTTADDVPGWDSMNHIFLVVEIEQQLGIKFKTAEMEELRNVGELVHLIEAKLGQPAA